MLGSTFNPNPRPGPKPSIEPTKPTPAAPTTPTAEQFTGSSGGNGRLSMLGKLSINWEPPWEQVLYDLFGNANH